MIQVKRNSKVTSSTCWHLPAVQIILANMSWFVTNAQHCFPKWILL